MKHENVIIDSIGDDEAATILTRSLRQAVELFDLKVVCIVLLCFMLSNISKDPIDLISAKQNDITCLLFCAFIGICLLESVLGKMLPLFQNVEDEVMFNKDMSKEEDMVEEQIEVGRSRFDQFHRVCHEEAFAKGSRRQRSREPSRVPVNELARVLKKSRAKRRFVRTYISKSIPKSSKVHRYTRIYKVHPTAVRERTRKPSNEKQSCTKKSKR